MCTQREMYMSINSIFITNFKIRIRSQAVAHGQGPPGPKICPPLPGVTFNDFLHPSVDVLGCHLHVDKCFSSSLVDTVSNFRTINKGKWPLKIQKSNQYVSPPPYSFSKKNKTERTPFQTESLTQRVNRKTTNPVTGYSRKNKEQQTLSY